MHLSHAIFQWPYGVDGKAFPPEIDYVSRAQEIWRHAAAKLKGTSSELDRVDCIGTLKRAINHRLKAIQATYHFDQLPTTRPKKQIFEKLQDYGLVRPAIIKELLEVRNGIEHNDAAPPDAPRCEFYVDVVWYFLKSTDALVDMAVDSIVYEDDQSESALYLSVKPDENWKFTLRGSVLDSYLPKDPKAGDLKLQDFATPTRRARRGYTKFTATVQPDLAAFQRLAQDYFSVSGYSHEDSEA
jgi:hypothetical protein